MAKKDLTYKFGANTAEVDKKLAQMSSKMKDLGRSMQNLGKSMSLYVTAPIMAMGAATVMAFNKQEAAEKKLRAALQANGRVVDSTYTKYKNFASEMQRLTVVGDEVTLEMLQVAESMGLTGDSAMRAVKNSIAMQEAFGVNAQSAIRMTSALEQGDATMLTRYIPALREVEDQTERAALAQDILSKSFSVATENAKTGQGAMVQMKNAVGDLMEQFGAIISEAITPFVVKIKELAERFQNLDEKTKKIIVVVAGLAAAIGPLLTVLGLLVSTIIPALIAGGTAIAAAWLPITAIILGVMGAFYLFNAEARKTKKIIDELSKKSTEELTNRLDEINKQLDTLESQRLKDLRVELNANKDKLKELTLGTKEHSDLLIRQGVILREIQKEEQAYSTNYAVIEKLKKEKKVITDLLGERAKMAVEPPTIPDPSPKASPTRIYEEIPDKIDKIGTKLLDMGDIVAEPFKKLGQTIYDLIPISDTVAVRFIQMFDAVGNKIRDTREVIIDLGKELSYLANDVLVSLAESMGNAFNGGTFKDGLNSLLITVADWAQDFGKMLIAAGVASEAFQKSLAANPILAIGAGVALIAAATAVKGALSQNPMAGAGSGGGGYGGGGQGSDLFGMRNLGQFSVAVTGTLRAEGSELITVIENENKRLNL